MTVVAVLAAASVGIAEMARLPVRASLSTGHRRLVVKAVRHPVETTVMTVAAAVHQEARVIAVMTVGPGRSMMKARVPSPDSPLPSSRKARPSKRWPG